MYENIIKLEIIEEGTYVFREITRKIRICTPTR